MMKKQILLALLIFVSFTGYIHSQTTVNGSFMHDGINRTYSFYVPASYTPGQPVPLVLNLHGYTSSGSLQAIYGDFRPIADTANFIVVHPDGTTDTGGQRFWNFGIAGTTVDDFGFLETLIDTISANYSINADRVYSTGMSNGGFMCYALACGSDRFAAIASVTGSMSVPMYNSCNPDHPTPVMHIHGTSDTTNPYAGNTTSKGIEDVVLFWVNNNSCNSTPAITAVPNTNLTDNTTAERYLYSGGVNGHTVEHFKVTGGGHTWPGSVSIPGNGNTCQDFSASTEIWRFFSQYDLSSATSIEGHSLVEMNVWPNPSSGTLYIKSENHTINKIVIMNLQGQAVFTKAGNNIQQVNLSGLNAGNYVVKLSGDDFHTVKKLMIAPVH